ncbi:MAG: hypothetical protein CMJ58_15145 [Planctomycetaceae bacterium]|nr:hypothetical protein [Planctomycetaceae bacterium]
MAHTPKQFLEQLSRFRDGLAGGEEASWLPLLDGDHPVLPGIGIDSGRIVGVDAATGERLAVRFDDAWTSLSLRTADGAVARLKRTGRHAAVLLYPDGAKTERLKAGVYNGQIYRHALVSFFLKGCLGGANVTVDSRGVLSTSEAERSVASYAPWQLPLPDGSRLECRGNCQVLHRGQQGVEEYLWSASQKRLLRCDFHRNELRFAWITDAKTTSQEVLDGLATVFADGSVQLWHAATKSRGEEIDFTGPGGICISRASGSDRLFIYQHDELVGALDFVPLGGRDDRGNVYDRWAYAAGGYAELPTGTPPVDPAVTAAVVAIGVAFGAAWYSEMLALAFVVPIAAGAGLTVAVRVLRPLARYLLP